MSYRIASRPILPKSPRVRDKAHLGRVSKLSCIICGTKPVEVAHIRYSDIEMGKSYTAKGQKPSDLWTLPICSQDHRTGIDAQHKSNEQAWYQKHGIDPIPLCLALYAISGNIDDMESLIRQARTLFPARMR